MEISTIIGIVIAIIICIVGLRMMLRKPDDATPSLDSELHVNQDSNQPVIPRHVRNQLQSESKTSVVSERIEPSLQAAAESEKNLDDKLQVEPKKAVVSEVEATEKSEQAQPLSQSTLTEQNAIQPENAPSTPAAANEIESEQVDSKDLAAKSTVEEDNTAKKESPTAEFMLNPNVQAAEIKEFDEESSILDVNLHEQQRYDDESTLANAETIIALNVYPNPRKALSGDKTLKVLLKYGLRFGEMRCFHRYEDPDKVSPLMFSVLRITEQGPEGFDLETLSGEQVQGLAFFLALPHPNVQKGYDSMVSIAGLIARETDGTVYDENNLEFTPQLKEHWRHKAIDYRPGKAL